MSSTYSLQCRIKVSFYDVSPTKLNYHDIQDDMGGFILLLSASYSNQVLGYFFLHHTNYNKKLNTTTVPNHHRIFLVGTKLQNILHAA